MRGETMEWEIRKPNGGMQRHEATKSFILIQLAGKETDRWKVFPSMAGKRDLLAKEQDNKKGPCPVIL